MYIVYVLQMGCEAEIISSKTKTKRFVGLVFLHDGSSK